ncbi:MAG TPA: GspE/PulE family protein [Phycisphaerae bacterium]|nr:GspE/PulE family protein [Phycisphaerae bacterium]
MSESLVADQPLLVQLLLDRGLLAEEDLREVHKVLSQSNVSIEAALVQAHLVTEMDVAHAYAEHLRLPLVAGEAELNVPRELAELVGERMCREKLIAPLAQEDGTLEVAFVNPTDLNALEQVQLLTGLMIRPVVAPQGRIEDAIGELFGKRDFVKEINTEARTEYRMPIEQQQEVVEEVVDLDRPIPKGRDGHVIRLVNHILTMAVKNRASDIHIESFEESVKLRMRIDGQLQELSPPNRSMYVPMVSRLKVLAKMDIAERRVPQDGAIALSVGSKRVDLRVSTIPTVHGEKMVMRILTKGAIPLDLTDLGFDPKQAEDFRDAAASPHGLLLVTGPTGSGKSTTLYAVLNLLNKPHVNIVTVEDPVEYKFEGLNQVQVRPQVGLTFASALRAFLRQDPDIIMVGEVRDQETAQICLRAALTGHLVLSTLHTNDALAAVNRLVDMGAERFLLASALRAVEAQRLVRKLCAECREPYTLDRETSEKWGLAGEGTYYRAKGCEACRETGYSGRVGLYEVIRVTPAIRDLIGGGASVSEIRKAVHARQVKLLADAGLDKVREGVTSLEEVLSVCQTESGEE